MRAQTWRGLAAGSSVLMATAIVFVYWRFVQIPFIEFVPAASYRSFLLGYPAMATCGLLLWGVASFRLKAGLWRYGLATLSGLAALAIIWLIVQTIAQKDIGRPWAVPIAFMPVILLGVLSWILWSKRTSFRWGRVIVYLVACLLVVAPLAAFLAHAYSLQAGLRHLGLALTPFVFVVLAYLIAAGFSKLSIINTLVFGLVGCPHLYWTIRGIGQLGKAFSSTSIAGVVTLGLIAVTALALALVNFKAFRAGRH